MMISPQDLETKIDLLKTQIKNLEIELEKSQYLRSLIRDQTMLQELLIQIQAKPALKQWALDPKYTKQAYKGIFHTPLTINNVWEPCKVEFWLMHEKQMLAPGASMSYMLKIKVARSVYWTFRRYFEHQADLPHKMEFIWLELEKMLYDEIKKVQEKILLATQ